MKSLPNIVGFCYRFVSWRKHSVLESKQTKIVSTFRFLLCKYSRFVYGFVGLCTNLSKWVCKNYTSNTNERIRMCNVIHVCVFPQPLPQVSYGFVRLVHYHVWAGEGGEATKQFVIGKVLHSDSTDKPHAGQLFNSGHWLRRSIYGRYLRHICRHIRRGVCPLSANWDTLCQHHLSILIDVQNSQRCAYTCFTYYLDALHCSN